MTRPTAYSVRAYGDMITCEPRMSAYAAALRRAVTPGCRVIDIGAGTGVFALLACQYGAGSVVAIEPDPAIELARISARDNGFADRITLVRDLSTKWQPDRLADVVISDIRGVMPLFEYHIPTVCDVRARLLAPGGVLIPGLDRIHAAVVEAPETYLRYEAPWRTNDYGLDMTAGLKLAMNSWRRVTLTPKALLGDPQVFATLDYSTIEQTNHQAALAFRTGRAGMAHGLLLWFDTELAPGIGFSNAPGAPEQIYGQAFFPLERPLDLAEGAEVRADISARLIDGQYVWSWSVAATDRAGVDHRFRQSSFKAKLFDKAALAPRAATFRPPAQAIQRIDIWCLQRFDGGTDLAGLGRELAAAFPDDFATERAAFDHVAELSARYNR